jgi:cell division protein FtsA
LLKGLQDVEAGKAPVPSEETVPANGEKEPSNVSEEKSPNWLDNVFRKTKEWFEAEPDMDFKK